MMEITSRENKNIKEYVKLVRDKKHRNQQNLFTVEGIKLVKEAFDSDVSLTKVFVTDDLLGKNENELRTILDAVPEAYRISEEIGKKLSDTKTPQGIFAIGKKLDKVCSFDTIYNKGYYLVLCGISDPGNLGTVFRTGDALGIDGILLTESCCDPYSPKAVRSAMGALFRVPFAMVDDILLKTAEWNQNGMETIASVVDRTEESVQSHAFSDGTMLYIGNEANGLPEDIQEACSKKLTIAMRGSAESLNASMAAGILMWEMLKS